MKKIIAFILTLAMLCTLLPACGGPKPSQDASSPQDTPSDIGKSDQASPEDLDEITHKLLADWYGYLIRCEYLYGDILWSLSYLDPFFEDHSWNNLQIARAALASAKRRAESVAEKPLELQMTIDDYDRLIQSGADVGGVQPAIDGIQVLVDAVLLSYHSYRDFLNSPAEEFFLTYNLAAFENWTHIEQQIYDIYLRECAVKTDYLLLSLDSEEEETRFVEYIAENCPQINAWHQENPPDQDGLEKLSSELLMDLERNSSELSSVLGQFKANLDLENDILDEDMDSLKKLVSAYAAYAVDLKNLPIALPYPNWWYNKDNEAFTYVWDNPEYGENEENGPRKFVMPGDTINSPPDSYMAKWADVSLKEYLDYVEIMSITYKIPAQDTWEKDGEHTAYYEFGPISFVLTWEENTVKLFPLDGSVCLAPPWYIYYTRLTDS